MPATTFPAALPPGLTVRRPDLDADRDAVVALVRAYDDAYVGRPTQPPEQVVADLASSGDDLAEDAWLVLDGDQVVGLAWFTAEDAVGEEPTLWFDVYVHPGAARPDGPTVEQALVDAMLDRARTWAASAPASEAASGAASAAASPPADVRAGASAASLRIESGCMRDDARTAAALRARGFDHIRTFWRMERPLAPAAGAEVPSPAVPGLVVRPARDEPDDRALLHRLFDATFAGHFGTVLRPHDEWWRRVRASVGVDPSQWFVAELDGDPVGFVLGDASRAPDNGGYVRTLGVLPAVRGRGIARHLLEVVFAEQARRGWTWTQLTVDSGNPTGAPGLYGSVGMSAVEVIDVYRTELPGSPPSDAGPSDAGPSSPSS